MAYTEHLRIRCPRNKAAPTSAPSPVIDNQQKARPVIHLVIEDDTDNEKGEKLCSASSPKLSEESPIL